MAQTTALNLSDKEKAEFNNFPWDTLKTYTDVATLKKMEAYFRQEGYDTTAQAVQKRLVDLGMIDPAADPATAAQTREELEKARKELLDFTRQSRTMDQALASSRTRDSIPSTRPGTSYPPVRPPTVIPVGGASSSKPAGGSSDSKGKSEGKGPQSAKPNEPKQDSKFGGQVRSGKDYYEKWDKFAEQELSKEDTENAGGAEGAVPGVKAARGEGQPEGAAGGPSTAGARGPMLTQKLIEINADLSHAERAWLAEQEKVKGNEHFRAKEYSQAVERYTLSLGYNPGVASVHANRAAAYLRLKMWAEAEEDCSYALAADTGYVKALVRRAAARLELGKAGQAMEDIETALVVEPDNKELLTMRSRAEKALGKTSMKRMVIEEVDDDDEEEEVQADAPAPKAPTPTPLARAASGTAAGANGTRRKIVVEEESDSDEEAAPAPAPAATDTKPQAAAPPPAAPVSAALQPTKAPAPAPAPAQPSQPSLSPKPLTPTSKPAEPEAEEPDVFAQPTLLPTPPAIAAPVTRTKIMVVDESESSDDEEVVVVATSKSAAAAPPPTAAPAPTPAAPHSASKQPVSQPSTPAQVSAPKPTTAAPAAPAPAPKQADVTAATPATALNPAPAPAPAPAPVPAPARPAPAAAPAPAPTAARPAPALAPAPPRPVVGTLEEEVEGLKDQGNKCFAAGNHARAIEFYTKALELAPDSSVLYSNRSLAKIKSGDAKGCLSDAITSSTLDPTNHKALHRMATAKWKLGLLNAAAKDLASALEAADPKSKTVLLQEIAKLEKDVSDMRAARAKAKAYAQRGSSKKQYQGGVVIEELEDEDDEDADHGQLNVHQLRRLTEQATQRALEARKAAIAARAAWEEKQATAAAAAADSIPAAIAPAAPAPAPVAPPEAAPTPAPVPTVKQSSPTPAPTVTAADSQPAKQPAAVPPTPASAAAPDANGAKVPEASAAPAAPEAASAAAATPAPVTAPATAPAPLPASSLAQASAPTAPQTESAADIKERGTQLFKSHDFQGAVDAWNIALTLCSGDRTLQVALHANLALAHTNIGNFEDAINHADTVMQMEKPSSATYHKALHRRALAKDKAGRLEAAMEDYRELRTLMRLSPKLIAEVDDLASRIQSQSKPASANAEQAPQASPAAPQPKDTTTAPPSSASIPQLQQQQEPASTAAPTTAGASAAAPTPTPVAPAAPAQPPAAASEPVASAVPPTPAADAAPAAPARRKIAIQEASDSDEEEQEPPPAAAPEPVASAAAPTPAADAAPAAPARRKIAIQEASDSDEEEQEPPHAAAATAAAATAAAATAAAATAAAAAATTTTVAPVQPAPPAPNTGISTSQNMQEVADKERLAGNDAYKAGNLQEALACYTRSIAAAPTAEAHGNLAMVLLRLNRHAEAESECRAALKLNGGYIKAKNRLAQALRAQGKASEAVPLLEEVCAALPQDLNARQGLASARKEAAAAAAAQAASVAAAAQTRPAPMPAPSAQQPAPTKRKIVIQEASSSNSDEDEGLVVARGAARPGSASSQQAPAAPTAAQAPDASQPSDSTTSGSPREASSEEAPGSVAPSGVSRAQAAAAAKAAGAIANLVNKRPPAPRTAVEFLNGCKMIGGSTKSLVDYIKSIDPSSYQSLFKASLDDSCLGHMLRALAQAVKSDPAFAEQSLLSLSKVDRFSMVSAMMPKQLKAAASETVQAIQASGRDVAALKKAYRV